MSLKVIEDVPTPTPNVLLYGAAGSGKTTGACSGPPKVHLLTTEPTNRSRFAQMLYGDDLIRYRVESLADLMDVTLHLQDLCEAGDESALGGTVVLDSMAELHTVLKEDLSKRALRPSLPVYGDVQTYVERAAKALCELPMTAVFIAHEKQIEDRANGTIELLPDMGTNNTAPAMMLMKLVDLVGYTAEIEIDGDEPNRYVAQLVNARGRRGKRLPGISEYEDVDLKEWITRIAAAGWAPIPSEQPEAHEEQTEEVATA
jgi:hypothetical protein